MKPKSIFLRCDTCGICVGPAFLYQNFYDVGMYKLCPPCYILINKEGFLYLGEKKGLAEVILLDGTKTLVSRKDTE